MLSGVWQGSSRCGEAMSKRDAWIRASVAISNDARARLECPDCGKGFLEVFDVSLPDNKFERYMVCSECHAKVVMLKEGTPQVEGGGKRPPSTSGVN